MIFVLASTSGSSENGIFHFILNLSSLGGLTPRGFLSVDFYQVHLQSGYFLTFRFYPCHDQ